MKTIFENEDEALKEYEDEYYGYNINDLSDEEVTALNDGKSIVLVSQDEYFIILQKEKIMNGQMQFPEKWEDFVMENIFTDHKQIYTNGLDLMTMSDAGLMMEHNLKQETDKVDKLYKKCAGYIQEKQEWIPCSERLPEGHDWVLVSTKMSPEGYCGIPHVAELRHGVWYCNCCDGPMEETLSIKVEAWMPLPEAYKESEK